MSVDMSDMSKVKITSVTDLHIGLVTHSDQVFLNVRQASYNVAEIFCHKFAQKCNMNAHYFNFNEVNICPTVLYIVFGGSYTDFFFFVNLKLFPRQKSSTNLVTPKILTFRSYGLGLFIPY